MDGRQLRCSDVDRERVAAALREAAAMGRLTMGELDDRLEAAFAARTYSDLRPLTEDLPEGAYPVPANIASQWQPDHSSRRLQPRRRTVPATRRPQYLPEARSRNVTALLTNATRTVPWRAPKRIEVLAVLADVVLDFCEATVPHAKVAVNVFALAGNVSVIVPDGVEVRTSDLRLVGDGARISDTRHGPALHGGPVYRLRGLVVRGVLSVRSPASQLG